MGRMEQVAEGGGGAGGGNERIKMMRIRLVLTAETERNYPPHRRRCILLYGLC